MRRAWLRRARRDDQHLSAADVPAEGGGCAEDEAALYSVLDYVGDRCCGVGDGGEY
jgi:hypothetical protein